MLGKLDFSPRWKQVLDLDLHLRMLLAEHRLVGLTDILYEYRRHAAQTTAGHISDLTFFTEQAELFAIMEKESRERGWVDAARVARGKRVVRLDLACQALGDLARLRFRPLWAKCRLWRTLDAFRGEGTVGPVSR
jgi:hypothetical protein